MVSGGRVLLLDDDPQFRALIKPALETAGLVVHEAAKGRIARRLVSDVQPDALIVDGLLPDTNGVKWIESYRREGGDLPIVFVSAFYRDIDSYKKLTKALNVAHVMHKPVTPTQLTRAVVDLLQDPSRSAPASDGSTVAVDNEVEDEIFYVPRESDQPPVPDDDDLKALRESYEAVLPELLEGLLRAADRVRRRPEQRAAVREAVDRAHKLAGSAGSYGFESLGDAAAVIEVQLRGLLQGTQPDWNAYDRALDQVRLLDQSRPPDPFAAREALRPGLVPGHGLPTLDPTASRLLGPRVLVADDDPALLDFVQTTLRGSIVQLAIANGMREVREHGAAIDAAVVGVPFGRPDASKEVVAELRRLQPKAPIAVVALDDGDATRKRAAATGADIFLAHPLDDAELARVLRRLEAMGTDQTPLRVLKLGKVKGIAESMSAADGIDVTSCDSMDELLRRLSRSRPHAVLLGDHEIGLRSRLIRMADGGSDVCILSTARGCLEVDAVVTSAASAVQAVLARGGRLRAMRRAGNDASTGLPRRVELAGLLMGALRGARRAKLPFTLAVLEIDNFDDLIAEHGASFSERVMAGVAQLLRSRFRVEDVRGRWQRSVFVLGFAGGEATALAKAVGRFQQDVDALQFASRGEPVRISFCTGLASAPLVGEELRDLLLAAEAQLRQAQQNGNGGRICATATP